MTDWSDLATAEQHIADSERRIDEIVVHVEARRAAGSDVAEAERTLRLMQEILEQWHIHRRLILEALDSRKSVSTD